VILVGGLGWGGGGGVRGMGSAGDGSTSLGLTACSHLPRPLKQPLGNRNNPITLKQVLRQSREFYAAQQRGETGDDEEYQLDYQVGGGGVAGGAAYRNRRGLLDMHWWC
jgi:hypothetical protein